MRIQRQITHAGESPFAGITSRTIDVEDCASDSKKRTCLTDIEVPAHWSREDNPPSRPALLRLGWRQPDQRGEQQAKT